MPTLPLATVTAFVRNERGSIAILFGFCAMVLMVTVGVAIDQARVYHSSSKIAAAADAAALAAGRALMEGAMSDEEIAALGRRYFNQNLSGGGTFADVNNVEVIPNRANSTIEVKVDAGIPMTFMRIAGVQNVAAPVDTLTTFEANDLELGMALDITGSMQGRKLADLKAAATDLVEMLLPDSEHPNKVRIGLAPYAAAIQLGSYADRASNGTSRDGCVRERNGRSAYTDDSIGDGGAYRGTGRFSDIDSTEGRQGYFCPSAPIVPLTEDKSPLITRSTALSQVAPRPDISGHSGPGTLFRPTSPRCGRRTANPSRTTTAKPRRP